MFEKYRVYLYTKGAIKAKLDGIYPNTFKMISKIKNLGIHPNTFIDVGANRGMMTKTVDYIYPNCNIYAFEPIKNCFSELQKLEAVITNLKSFNCALSDYSGTAVFNESLYDYSSSLLKMAEKHKEIFPYTKETSTYSVEVYPLEYFIDKMELTGTTLLKLDVQGAELKVMRGAEKILHSIDYVLCELSIVELYKGQPLALEVVNYMSEKGFNLIDILELNRGPMNNELLQFDVLFKRNY
jgi:FkbM family methyltransferase